jgi:hypothetical protein
VRGREREALLGLEELELEGLGEVSIVASSAISLSHRDFQEGSY